MNTFTEVLLKYPLAHDMREGNDNMLSVAISHNIFPKRMDIGYAREFKEFRALSFNIKEFNKDTDLKMTKIEIYGRQEGDIGIAYPIPLILFLNKNELRSIKTKNDISLSVFEKIHSIGYQVCGYIRLA